MCFAVGESLYIARPVVYAALLYFFSRRSRVAADAVGSKRVAPWTPWLVSLLVDVTSLSLLNIGNKYARGCVAAGHPCPDRFAMATYGLSKAEQQELQRRRFLLLFYLLRSPFFENVANRPLRGIKGALGVVPLIGSLAEWGYELIESIQSYHFYTSAS